VPFTEMACAAVPSYTQGSAAAFSMIVKNCGLVHAVLQGGDSSWSPHDP
jgi:hypothetical protein